MDRASDKHGPRIDEEMKKETESITQGAPAEARVEGERLKEGPGDEQPEVEQVLHRTGPDIPDRADPQKEATAHGTRPDTP